jgi:hypothetical protein
MSIRDMADLRTGVQIIQPAEFTQLGRDEATRARDVDSVAFIA